MDKIIKTVLKKFEDNKFEAYIVGGYVRDRLLKKHSFDIDIATTALPKDIHELFPNAIQNKFGGFTFNLKKYSFDITTYRTESDYFNCKPQNIEYIKDISLDAKRRDFTVNAMYMNKSEKIVDFFNAKNDMKNKVLKTIGDASVRIVEDPLRILRAIRFATVLNYTLDSKLEMAIKDNKILLKKISDAKLKQEFSKLLMSKNVMKGITLIKELELDKILNINCDNVIFSEDLLVMFAQLKFDKKIFSKIENKSINTINIIRNYGTIDNAILFKYGLYHSMSVGGILGISKNQIIKQYKGLWISNEKPLVVSAEEIMKIMNLDEGAKLGQVINDLTDKILNKKLKNEKKAIMKYLTK